MSSLQKRIARGQKGEGTQRGSRSHSASGQSSRAESRFGSDDDDDDYISNSFLSSSEQADVLANDLRNLLNLKETEDDGKPQTQTDKLSSAADLLDTDRRSTSLEAREQALATSISILSQKYDPDRAVSVSSYIPIYTKAFVTARSEKETVLSLQAICVLSALDIDETFDALNQAVLPQVFEIMNVDPNDEEASSSSNISVGSRANIGFAYSLLQYIANFGSGGYKVDALIESLVDIATQCSSNEEAAVSSVAILGVGLLSSLLDSPNNIIADFLPVMIDFLESSSSDIRLAAGKVIALFYQLYDYSEDEDEDEYLGDEDTQGIPFVDHDELLIKLKELTNEGSRKMAKKDKREQKSLFRDVANTVDIYTSKSRRASVTPEELLITHIKLSKSKSFSIDTWTKLLLIQHLRWAFGPGIHTQIAHNPAVHEWIKDSSNVKSIRKRTQFDFAPTAEDTDRWNTDSAGHKLYDEARTRKIRNERLEKELEKSFNTGEEGDE